MSWIHEKSPTVFKVLIQCCSHLKWPRYLELIWNWEKRSHALNRNAKCIIFLTVRHSWKRMIQRFVRIHPEAERRVHSPDLLYDPTVPSEDSTSHSCRTSITTHFINLCAADRPIGVHAQAKISHIKSKPLIKPKLPQIILPEPLLCQNCRAGTDE